jgi:hypothetical protein
MAITITSTPAKDRDGITSNWVACNNPVLFSFTTSGSPLDDFIQLALYEADGTTQIVELKRMPFPTSEVVDVDFQAFLQSELSNDDDSLTVASSNANYKENQYKVFRVGYRTTSTGSYTVDTTEYIALNAVRQALSPYGQNMADYLYSVDYGTSSLDFLGKFFTEFEQMPLFWYSPVNNPIASEVTYFFPSIGVPLTKNMIDNDAGYEIQTQYYDADGTTSNGVTALNVFTDEGFIYINYASVASPAYQFAYLETNMQSRSISNLIIIPDYRMIPTRVCNNPVAIKWKTDLGGWDVWVFEGNSPVTVGVETTDTYANPYTDLQSLTEVNRQYQKRRTPLQSVSADGLSLNYVKALSKVLSSPNVLLCVSDLSVAGASAEDWVTVNVLDGDTQLYDQRLNKYRFEMEFELLEEFTISN